MNEEFASEPYNPAVKKIHYVVLNLCSDSRNTTVAYYKAKEKIMKLLAEEGTLVVVYRMNDPGVYMTLKTMWDIKDHILATRRQYHEFIEKGVEFAADVHVVAHANARHRQEFSRIETFEPDQIFLTACKTNCGMSHAASAVEGLLDFVLGKKPVFTVDGGKKMDIRNENDLKEFMKITYGEYVAQDNWDGDLLTVVKDIKDLRYHPREQMDLLDKSIENDQRFSGMELGKDIRTFAHVLSYAKNKVYRVDGKSGQKDVFLGPIFNEIRKHGPPSDQEIRMDKQDSPFRIISDPQISGSRLIFAKKMGAASPAGRVFSIARKLDLDPFDYTSMLGIFYALSPDFLNKKNNDKMGIVAIGDDGVEVAKNKIRKDNLANLIINTYINEKYTVALDKRVVDRRQHFPNMKSTIQTGSKKIIRH